MSLENKTEKGLCQHKEIFGRPNEGVHSYRVLDIAVVDVVGTIAISLLLSKSLKVSLFVCFLALIVVGVISHELFCVDTALNRKLGLGQSSTKEKEDKFSKKAT